MIKTTYFNRMIEAFECDFDLAKDGKVGYTIKDLEKKIKMKEIPLLNDINRLFKLTSLIKTGKAEIYLIPENKITKEFNSTIEFFSKGLNKVVEDKNATLDDWAEKIIKEDEEFLKKIDSLCELSFLFRYEIAEIRLEEPLKFPSREEVLNDIKREGLVGAIIYYSPKEVVKYNNIPEFLNAYNEALDYRGINAITVVFDKENIDLDYEFHKIRCNQYDEETLTKEAFIKSKLAAMRNRLESVITCIEKEIMEAEHNLAEYKKDQECPLDYDMEIQEMNHRLNMLRRILRKAKEDTYVSYSEITQN